jgi:hypothetical protein
MMNQLEDPWAICRSRAVVAPPKRDDPYKAFNFLVEIDGIARAVFSEIGGLESETVVIEYRAGGEPNTVRKLPGLTKYANIVLRRGITKDAILQAIFVRQTPQERKRHRSGRHARARAPGISSTADCQVKVRPRSRRGTRSRSRRPRSRTKGSSASRWSRHAPMTASSSTSPRGRPAVPDWRTWATGRR